LQKRDVDRVPDGQFTVSSTTSRSARTSDRHGRQWLRQVFAGLNPERILVGAICSGVGRYAIGKAADYARQRQVWSTPIGAHQGIAHAVAEAPHRRGRLGRLAPSAVPNSSMPGSRPARAANIASSRRPKLALKALDQAIQTHGGNGLSMNTACRSCGSITRLMRTAPVSREMVLNSSPRPRSDFSSY